MHPADPTLPLFVYGMFQPGELAWLRLRAAVDAAEPGWSIRGELLERDGLAILDLDGPGDVNGWLLSFRADATVGAYDSIADLEPEQQYRWAQATAVRADTEREVNVLAGRSPRSGSTPMEGPWAGRTDPLLTVGLDVVDEMAASVGSPSPSNVAPLLRLQAAYMLLCTAIERYASLRYGLRGGNITTKLHRVAEEPAFVAALGRHVTEVDRIRRADDPSSSERLDPSDSLKSIDYYYQLRSNISHRGKASVVDFNRLAAATGSLLAIFREVVAVAFEDAAAPPGTS